MISIVPDAECGTPDTDAESSTGLVAVVGLPAFEVLLIMARPVFLAGVIIAIATRGELGLNPKRGCRLNLLRVRRARYVP